MQKVVNYYAIRSNVVEVDRSIKQVTEQARNQASTQAHNSACNYARREARKYGALDWAGLKVE
jgi:hypothetical protein